MSKTLAVVRAEVYSRTPSPAHRPFTSATLEMTTDLPASGLGEVVADALYKLWKGGEDPIDYQVVITFSKKEQPDENVGASLEAKLDVLSTLVDATHSFWTSDGVKRFTAPFGFEGRCHVEKANTGDPKGLTLNDSANSATGASTGDVTGQIVRYLGLESPGMLGRGSQVRADIATILKHLQIELPASQVITGKDGRFQVLSVKPTT